MPDPATSLRDRYTALSEQLGKSPIEQGLYLESVESSRTLRGDVYAVVDYPFAAVSEVFTRPESWREALILHLNVKYCQVAVRGERTLLSIAIGKKVEQPLGETYRVELTYSVTVSTPDYVAIDLYAKKGPLGTKNYNIAGFTTVGGENGQPPHLVGGVRAALERNAMRYYLAIDAYLGATAASAPERFDESLERWFAATERYALQLHEVEYDAYVAMKRREYLRQQILP